MRSDETWTQNFDHEELSPNAAQHDKKGRCACESHRRVKQVELMARRLSGLFSLSSTGRSASAWTLVCADTPSSGSAF